MTPRLFRALIALYLLCVVLAVASHVLTAPDLPPALRSHVEAQDAVSWMVGAGGVAYLVLASIATAGLMLFRAWARPLFAVVAVCGANRDLDELQVPLVECYDAFGIADDHMYTLTIDRGPWNARFAVVRELYVEYFDTGPLGGGASRFDSVLHVPRCAYRWRPLVRERIA